MELGSLGFATLSLGTLAAWHLVYSRTFRLAVLVLAGLVLAGSHLQGPRPALLLGGTVVAGYAVSRWLQLRGSAWGLGAWLALLLGLFLVNKDLVLPGRLGQVDPRHPTAILGFSLVFFKLVHLAVDAQQQALRPLRPLTYLAWMMAFFTWLAGPLPRYNDFAEQVEEGLLAPPSDHLLPALNRMVHGATKLFVACPFLLLHIGPEPVREAARDPGALALALLVYFFGYYVYLYLNFSGYCDLVLALALLFGLRIPENFDRPYLARNLLEYWQRWHITLSEWFRDYLFNPTYLALSSRTGRRRWVFPATVAYTLTFLATGLWHGATWNYLLFGLTHGVGALSLRYSWALAQRLVPGRALAWYRGSTLVAGLGCLATNSWVALSLLFFGRPLGELRQMLHLAEGLWR